MQEADPRVIALVRKLDEERTRWVAAEKREAARGVLTRLKAERMQDATRRQEHERRQAC